MNIADKVGVKHDSLIFVLKISRIFVLKMFKANDWTLLLGSWASAMKLSKTFGRYLDCATFSGEASIMVTRWEIAAMRFCQSLDWSN